MKKYIILVRYSAPVNATRDAGRSIWMHNLHITGARAELFQSKACLIMSKTHLRVFLYLLANRETKQKWKKKLKLENKNKID